MKKLKRLQQASSRQQGQVVTVCAFQLARAAQVIQLIFTTGRYCEDIHTDITARRARARRQQGIQTAMLLPAVAHLAWLGQAAAPVPAAILVTAKSPLDQLGHG